MLCYAMLCYAMLCYAMLCYAKLMLSLCYAMLCYAMLCYAMLGAVAELARLGGEHVLVAAALRSVMACDGCAVCAPGRCTIRARGAPRPIIGAGCGAEVLGACPRGDAYQHGARGAVLAANISHVRAGPCVCRGVFGCAP